MLSYAFRILQETTYESVSTEYFEHIHDLFAAILSKGMEKQIKQGLHKEYIEKTEDIKTLKGKLNITQNIKNKVLQKQYLNCEFDELSENNVFNQIIKSTIELLLKEASVKTERKATLRKITVYLSEVDSIDLSNINWSTLKFHRNNMHYRMMLNICYLTIDGLLLTGSSGEQKLLGFLDNQQRSSLFERFVLEYYRYHHKNLKVTASHVAWNVNEGNFEFLPTMKTDIMIKDKDKTLIIDTKYYARSMQHREEYDSYKLHSSNLYQIFTYVKNEDTKQQGNVSGLLFYAKTNETIAANADFVMSGNKISVRTLDLNVSFNDITKQLEQILVFFDLIKSL